VLLSDTLRQALTNNVSRIGRTNRTMEAGYSILNGALPYIFCSCRRSHKLREQLGRGKINEPMKKDSMNVLANRSRFIQIIERPSSPKISQRTKE
jgi:predicted component of type VI protein secretion system